MATITVQDLAVKLDTDARTTRKFLRSVTPRDDQPGKGSRWAIEAKQVQSLKSKFKKFQAEQAEKATARATVTADEVDEAEVMVADEPTAEELEAIDNEG